MCSTKKYSTQKLIIKVDTSTFFQLLVFLFILHKIVIRFKHIYNEQSNTTDITQSLTLLSAT